MGAIAAERGSACGKPRGEICGNARMDICTGPKTVFHSPPRGHVTKESPLAPRARRPTELEHIREKWRIPIGHGAAKADAACPSERRSPGVSRAYDPRCWDTHGLLKKKSVPKTLGKCAQSKNTLPFVVA